MSAMKNGDQPERLNSRTITVWLPQGDIDYLSERAIELGLSNRDGSPNRNGALRAILETDQKNRRRRLAKR